MKERLQLLGWSEIEIIDEDLGRSASENVTRTGFERMVAEVSLNRVGAVATREVSRFARNSRDWQQLVEVCRVVDTLLIDQEVIYDPRRSNDRLLLGLKGSLNEYELDLLRQRAQEARREKALRGELILVPPVGYVQSAEGVYEKDPDLRVQHAILQVFDKFLDLSSIRQVLFWFVENDLQLPARHFDVGGWHTRWRRPKLRGAASNADASHICRSLRIWHDPDRYEVGSRQASKDNPTKASRAMVGLDSEST
jgi:DNA invertase Pin-like site-specific DNA recombinase